jgi:hypothetical protein
MSANGSSVNTANIITALGNAFKDPSGAALPNDRLAAVLIQNMNQLNDLAKQGKLNQQQIMQVRSWSHPMLNRTQFFNWAYYFARLATGLCRQAQARDDDDKTGAWTWVPRVPSIPFLSHTSSLHARHGQPRRAFFVPF